jgi:hypothetical protein
MCIRRFVTILAFACLLALCTGGGCNEETLKKVDQAVQEVNAVAHTVTASPATSFLPPEVRILMEILGIGASLAFALWQRLRASGLLSTGAAIVHAIEKLPRELQDQVKPAVKAEMQDREIYGKANAIVDQLKKA